MLPALSPDILFPHGLRVVLIVPGVVVLLLLILRQRNACQRRHRRYQKQASRALHRLPQLRDEAARMVWLRKMDPYVFEEMLLTALSRQGLRIQRNVSYSGDGGIDGQVWIHGQRWLIQAKRYRATINAGHVDAFGQLARTEGCFGLFVHTGRTGRVSRDAFRRHHHIHLISGQHLLWMLSGDSRWRERLAVPRPRGNSPHPLPEPAPSPTKEI